MKSNWLVARASPDHRALKTEFEIAGGPETDLLSMDPRMIRIDVPFERANQKLVAERAKDSGDSRNSQRFGTIESKGIDVFSVA